MKKAVLLVMSFLVLLFIGIVQSFGQTCSGSPNQAIVTAPLTVCPSISFTVNSTGYSTGFGISYQWQYSNDSSVTWNNVVGATNHSYSASSGIISPIVYRMITTCSNSGLQDTSGSVTINISSFFECYCGPATGIYLNNGPDNMITNVSIVGTTLNNSTSAINSNGYTLFYPTTLSSTGSLNQGQTYTLQVSISYAYSGQTLGVWLDFNGNGVFESSEFITMVDNGSYFSGTISMPINAAIGQTGMRLRSYFDPWYYSPNSACTQAFDMETQDYVLSINATSVCSGTPNVSNATAPNIVCPNLPFTLSATGYSYGSGISYQWQSSIGSSNTWTNISGATSTTVSVSITDTTNYRLLTNCSNSGLQSFSNTVTVNPYSFFQCYCGPTTGNALCNGNYNLISNVTISGTTLNNSTTNAGMINGYTLFYPSTTNTTTTLLQGQTYTINIHVASSYDYLCVWFDNNANGIFESSELVPMSISGNIATGTMFIPNNATIGQTGLRIRESYFPLFATNACTYNLYNETEDYVVNISAGNNCTGTPNAGLITTTAAINCPNTAFTLNASNSTTGVGISYQWQSKPDSINSVWTDITGETNNSFVNSIGITDTTYYRILTTCFNSGITDSSNETTIYTTICYCIPPPKSPYYHYDIMDVTFAGISNSSSYSGTWGYIDYTNTISPAICTIGHTYPFNVTLDTGVANINVYYNLNGQYAGVWIDYNHNGVFEIPEFTYIGQGAGPGVTPYAITKDIKIPCTATSGITRMRVTSSLGYVLSNNACESILVDYGETEDYLVNLIIPPPCSSAPDAGTASAPLVVCANHSFTLSDNTASEDCDIIYSWEMSPYLQNNWVSIPNATNRTYQHNGISSSMDFRLKVTCTSGNLSSYSNEISVLVAYGIINASGPLALCNGGTVTLSAGNGLMDYLWNTGDTTQSITVNSAGTYSVSYIDVNGCLVSPDAKNVISKTLPSSLKIISIGTTTICDPGTVGYKVDPNAVNTFGFDFQWNVNGMPISGATDTIYSANGVGSGNITLSIAGSTCSKSSMPKAYTIKPLPIASFTAAGPTTFCQGQSVMLTAPTTSGNTYTWLKNGLSAGNGSSKIFKLAGNYTVIAKLNGCSDTASPVMSIVVNPLPVAGVAAINATTFCAGDSCTIVASPTGAVSYEWHNGTFILDTTATEQFKVGITTTIKVLVKDANGCIGKLSATSIKTKVNAIPMASISSSGSTTISSTGSVKLKATPSSGVTWQWFKDGNLISNATANAYIANAGGTYTVAITKLGCTGTSSGVVVTQTIPKENAVTTIDSSFEMSAYPNPVSDVLTIQINGLQSVDAELLLIDVYGKLLGKWNWQEGSRQSIARAKEMNLDLGNYASGIYFIRYKDKNGKTGTLKIVKE